jgi:hypothetical protein
MKDKLQLRRAYDIVLGGTMAISPRLYSIALQDIARLVGRVVDNEFLNDIKEISREISEENKDNTFDW